MGGKGGGGSSDNAYNQQLGAIGTGQYWAQTGLESAFIRDMSRILGAPNPLDPKDPTFNQWDKINAQKANYDVSELPTYEPLFGLSKQSLEQQYQQAKKNIMAQNPSGGNLSGALSGLESSRAATMGAVPATLGANILQDWINKAYGLVSGQGSLSGQALQAESAAGSNAANMQASKLAAQTAANNASYGLLGSVGEGIGKAVGAGK